MGSHWLMKILSQSRDSYLFIPLIFSSGTVHLIKGGVLHRPQSQAIDYTSSIEEELTCETLILLSLQRRNRNFRREEMHLWSFKYLYKLVYGSFSYLWVFSCFPVLILFVLLKFLLLHLQWLIFFFEWKRGSDFSKTQNFSA